MSSIILPFIRKCSKLKYCDQQLLSLQGRNYIRKTTGTKRAIVVYVGNLYLSLLNSGIRLLSNRQWMDRERLLYRSHHNLEVKKEGNKIFLPFINVSGLPVLLLSNEKSVNRKMSAIRQTTRELYKIHTLTDNFTHGDATSENVLYDEINDKSYWIDFETVHKDQFFKEEKKADDLITFLFSLVKYFDCKSWEFLIVTVLNSYPDKPVINEVVKIMRKERGLFFKAVQADIDLSVLLKFRLLATLQFKKIIC